MPFSPLSLQSPCLVSTGNSGLPSFGGGSTAGKQACGRGGEPRGKLRVPRSPDGSREFCAQDAEISGKFGVPPTLFPNGIGARECGEIRGSLDPLPERNWCKCGEIRGSHVCPYGIRARSTRSPGIYVRTKLVPSLGDSGSPGIYICSDETRGKPGRFGVPQYIRPDETRAKPRRFGVRGIYVRTKSVQLWEIWRFGVPRYMSGRNSCESRGFGVPPRSIVQAWEICPPRTESTWVDTVRVQKFGVPRSPSKRNLCKCGSFRGPPSCGIRTSVGGTFAVPRPVRTDCRIRGSPVLVRKKLVHGPFEVLRHRQRASGCAKISLSVRTGRGAPSECGRFGALGSIRTIFVQVWEVRGPPWCNRTKSVRGSLVPSDGRRPSAGNMGFPGPSGRNSCKCGSFGVPWFVRTKFVHAWESRGPPAQQVGSVLVSSKLRVPPFRLAGHHPSP